MTDEQKAADAAAIKAAEKAAKAAEKAAAKEAAKAEAPKLVKVYAPNEKYDGVSADVRFVNGEGQVEESNLAALAYFKEAGYHIGKRPESK